MLYCIECPTEESRQALADLKHRYARLLRKRRYVNVIFIRIQNSRRFAKASKGDNEGALSTYKALYDSGIIRSTYILPYSVLLLREGGEENYERVKQILIKAQKASDLNPQRKQQLFINYSVACWKTGEKDRAIQLMEASHRELPSGLTYNTLGFLYVEAGDAEKALPFNLEAGT